MPLYMDMHEGMGDVSEEEMVQAHMADLAVQDQFEVTLHTYWLNKETGTANCLYEAPSAGQANAMHMMAHGG